MLAPWMGGLNANATIRVTIANHGKGQRPARRRPEEFGSLYVFRIPHLSELIAKHTDKSLPPRLFRSTQTPGMALLASTVNLAPGSVGDTVSGVVSGENSHPVP